MLPGLCELGDLSTQSGVVCSDGLDLFRFLSLLPSQQRHSLFEPSVLFTLSVGVRGESAYQCSTKITAVICQQ